MEQMLFKQFKRGKERALAVYFEKHVRALLLFAYHLVKDEFVAEELVQDAFVKLWDSRGRMENEKHLKAFLYQATRNASIDYIRSAQNRAKLSPVESDDDFSQIGDDLLARMIHAETLQMVYDEVKRLSSTQQLVFRLTFIEELTTEEICAELDMTANAVFIARSKALAALHKIFKGKDLLMHLAFFSFFSEHIDVPVFE